MVYQIRGFVGVFVCLYFDPIQRNVGCWFIASLHTRSIVRLRYARSRPPLSMGSSNPQRWYGSVNNHRHSKQKIYRKISNIRRTKSQNLIDSHLALHSSLPNPLKPGVESRMKMSALLQLHLSDQQLIAYSGAPYIRVLTVLHVSVSIVFAVCLVPLGALALLGHWWHNPHSVNTSGGVLNGSNI